MSLKIGIKDTKFPNLLNTALHTFVHTQLVSFVNAATVAKSFQKQTLTFTSVTVKYYAFVLLTSENPGSSRKGKWVDSVSGKSFNLLLSNISFHFFFPEDSIILTEGNQDWGEKTM